jgi:hypothetical protein
LILRRPDIRDDVTAWMQATHGNAFVRRALAIVQNVAAPAARTVVAPSAATPAPVSMTALGEAAEASPVPGTQTAPAAAPSPAASASASTAAHPTAAVVATASATPPTYTDGEFLTLTGNAIAKTTEQEAAVLNTLRAEPHRFDPPWLVSAQRALGVVDATGAMNAETLRAMRTRSSNRSLGATGILDASFLARIAPGEPFLENATSFEDHLPRH